MTPQNDKSVPKCSIFVTLLPSRYAFKSPRLELQTHICPLLKQEFKYASHQNCYILNE